VGAPREPQLDLDAQRRVVGVLGQRGGEHLGAGAEALPVRAHPAKACQRVRPFPAGRRLGDDLLE
jgi:hypothetical protein